jgi:hypothetical protein
MKNTIKWFGIVALVVVIGFSITACGGDDDNSGGGSGVLDGTTWGDGSNQEQVIKFTGSNYDFDNGASKGTYTLAKDGKDLAFKETSPTTTKTYKGYYFPNDNPPAITANFVGANVDYYKK